MNKLISQGAEAKIFFETKENLITKDRIPKSYRIKQLDDKIRKRRTKSEAKLLTKASKIVNTPIPFLQPGRSYQIKMPFIKGKKLSDFLDSFSLKKQKEICKQIGKDLAKLHDENIIHGDLTTSNLIFVHSKAKDKIFFIDFGLGFFNGKYEDKAVDIHLFKQALEAKHYKNWEGLFEEFSKGYKTSKNSKLIFQRLKAVEKRGRYRH